MRGALRKPDERGITLILFALMLTVLLAFVALALDSGLVFNQRRQDQSAADAAALAAMKELADTITPADNRANAVKAVYDFSWDNLGTTSGSATKADWIARWTACSDPGRDSALYPNADVSSESPCISFAADDKRVRVRLPDIAVSSTFGQVVGVDDFDTSADSEAEVVDQTTSYVIFGLSLSCTSETVEVADNTSVSFGVVHSNSDATADPSPSTQLPQGSPLSWVLSPPPLYEDNEQVEPRGDPLAGLDISDYQAGGSKAVGPTWVDAGNTVIDEAFLLGHGYDPATDQLNEDHIFFTTNRVRLPNLKGRSTFVSTDSIELEGTDYDLRPSAADSDRVLFFTTHRNGTCKDDDAIDFHGAAGTWSGIVYARNGGLEMGDPHIQGQGNDDDDDEQTVGDPDARKTVNGMLVANKLDLDGSNYRFSSAGFQSVAPPLIRLYR